MSEEAKFINKTMTQDELNEAFRKTVCNKNTSIREIKELIEKGADVNAKNEDDVTALDLATDYFLNLQQDDKCEHKEKDNALKRIEILLKAGANPENISWTYTSMDDDSFEYKYGYGFQDDENTKIAGSYMGMTYFYEKTSLRDKLSKINDLTIKQLVKNNISMYRNNKISNIEKRKLQIKKSYLLRKEIEKLHPEERISGPALADKIAKDIISGKKKRTITPEIGAEIRRRKAAEK